VTGDTFLPMMENSTLCHVCVGRVFQSDGAPHHIYRRVRTLIDRKFPDVWIGRGRCLSMTSTSPLDVFVMEFVKSIFNYGKLQDMNKLLDRCARRAECVNNETLVNKFFKRVVPLMLSTEETL